MALLRYYAYFLRYYRRVWAARGGVIVSKVVSLEKLRLRSEVDPHWVSHSFGVGPHLSFAWEITIAGGLKYNVSNIWKCLFTSGRYKINIGRIEGMWFRLFLSGVRSSCENTLLLNSQVRRSCNILLSDCICKSLVHFHFYVVTPSPTSFEVFLD